MKPAAAKPTPAAVVPAFLAGFLATWRHSLRADCDRWLLLAAVLLLAATFLRPSLPMTRSAHELLIVLDITQSMNVNDYALAGRPASRLDFARAALRRTLPDLPCGSHIGWAIFTEYRSFLLLAPVEVCAHEHELLATLERIDGRMAWSGNSEIAKGVHSALKMANSLPGKPAIVFISDGHEAPPLNPRHRPQFDGKAGEVRGLIVGTGGLVAAPIPKFDADGRPLGVWNANEVMQTDAYSQGRGGSVGAEQMVETDPADPAVAAAIGPPGAEHLSALHEGYLKLLASETGLHYLRLDGDDDGLRAALLDPQLGIDVAGQFDLRLPLAALALVAFLAVFAGRRTARA